MGNEKDSTKTVLGGVITGNAAGMRDTIQIVGGTVTMTAGNLVLGMPLLFISGVSAIAGTHFWKKEKRSYP